MDGKGRCIDNIFIERLWRSLKYECVYLHAWEIGSQARVGIGRWITFYNHQRLHTAHGGQLRTHLADFKAAYNFARRLKTLGGLTPYKYICKIWTSDPDRSILDPIHQMPGLKT